MRNRDQRMLERASKRREVAASDLMFAIRGMGSAEEIVVTDSKTQRRFAIKVVAEDY